MKKTKNSFACKVENSDDRLVPADEHIGDMPANQQGTVNPDTEWKRVYYYSADHLGSSRLVLNSNGVIVERLMFLPTGEVFKDEQNSTLYHSDFLFSGKEIVTSAGTTEARPLLFGG